MCWTIDVLDHSMQVWLGDAFDQLGIQGAGVFRVLREKVEDA